MQLGVVPCRLCPRHCGAVPGFCGSTQELEVASVCVHQGEEPPLNPIVNVFFAHCNLHCIYCQNWQISGERGAESGEWRVESVESLAERICSVFSTLRSPFSTPMLGFVTAAHYADRIPAVVEAVSARLSALPSPLPAPTVVYNSSGYESVETLRSLEGVVDIYLPDFKYSDPALALCYSHAEDYPEVAEASISEMIRQVGHTLKVDSDGTAYRGLIVRHLVLPGHVENSLGVLDRLAKLVPDTFSALRSPLSTLHLSLMSQYYPPRPGLPAPLDRTLSQEEYDIVARRYDEMGFDGWLQQLDSQSSYRPDFDHQDNPFT